MHAHLILIAAALQGAFGQTTSFRSFLVLVAASALASNISGLLFSCTTTSPTAQQPSCCCASNCLTRPWRRFAAGLVTYSMGVNQFADMTPEEIAAGFKTLPWNATGSSKLLVDEGSNSSAIPDSLDWREKGIVTGVKNQGTCGACWAFSAIGALEAQLALSNGNLTSLSEQQLLDCDTKENNGCSGGTVQAAFEYVIKRGLTSEELYPYLARQGSCFASKQTFVRAERYADINEGDEDGLKKAVALIGPVSVAMNADTIVRYSGGIFNDSCSTEVNHGLLVVGYGSSEAGQHYWIVKNSWGEAWGENGYIRMAMGKGLCGIALQACYPLGVTSHGCALTHHYLVALWVWACFLMVVLY